MTYTPPVLRMRKVSSSAAQVKLVRKKIKPIKARGEQTKGDSTAAATLSPMQPLPLTMQRLCAEFNKK
jgi:hypothetical protein